MRTIKITLAYDGTDFVGWQRQAEGASVQGALEDALGRIERATISTTGAGRTDAGVHAAGQVASASIGTTHDAVTLRRALNAILPHAVRVIAIEDVPQEFHARFDAIAKTYHYRIVNGPVVSPFVRRWAWHVPWRLDVARMGEAAALVEGEHDFAAFQSTGGHVKTTVRTLTRSALLVATDEEPPAADPGPLPMPAPSGARALTYVVTGNGFLRHMVRAIVGTLVEVGSGRAEPALMRELFARPSRQAAGPTAPACGLCLAHVAYPARSVAAQR